MNAQTERYHKYSDDEVELLALIGDLAAGALEAVRASPRAGWAWSPGRALRLLRRRGRPRRFGAGWGADSQGGQDGHLFGIRLSALLTVDGEEQAASEVYRKVKAQSLALLA